MILGALLSTSSSCDHEQRGESNRAEGFAVENEKERKVPVFSFFAEKAEEIFNTRLAAEE